MHCYSFCFKFSIIFQKYLNNNKNKFYLNLEDTISSVDSFFV